MTRKIEARQYIKERPLPANAVQQDRPPMTEKIIANVRSGSLTEKGLANLYNNVQGKNLPGVIDAIEQQMRGQFPKAANRLFGKKEAAAVEPSEGTPSS